MGRGCAALLILGLLGCESLPDSVQPARGAPNIVFILIDDLGWADLPSYGNRFTQTPNIDRLVRDGIRFTDFYAAGVASHLPLSIHTVAEALRDAGYATGHSG